ncbi:MAG: hypothetical protein E7662_05730 [Ruminococcaceae bacterium]|nr:hypothetical protein [Oscillospiraceae bacterium]
MNITDKNVCAEIVDKIKEIRGGNRLMASNDVNLAFRFYRRDNPDKQCGVMKINGVFDFSLLDAGIALGTAALMLHILGGIARVLRKLR